MSINKAGWNKFRRGWDLERSRICFVSFLVKSIFRHNAEQYDNSYIGDATKWVLFFQKLATGNRQRAK
jgi:hypothetical protein